MRKASCFFMYLCLSNFYQNVGFSPSRLIFSRSVSLQGFLKLLYAGKLVYEICFFFANRTFHLLLLESFCV